MSGVQPQGADGLQCLECGLWFKLLAPHLARAHDMTTAQYREAHHLPRKLSLRAADLSRRASEQGKARYRDREDIRAALADGPRHQTRTASAEGTRATAGFPMVVEARRRGGQGKKDAARKRVDERAQLLGYPSFGDLLAARQGVPDTRIASEVDLPRSTVREWRLRLAEAEMADPETAPWDTEATDAETITTAPPGDIRRA